MPLPPLSLYVHVPWCVRKCPYCDFNSHGVGHEPDLPERAYLAALLEDLEAELPFVADRELESVFIGGGTPSLMSSRFYHDFFTALRGRLPLSKACEITLEANPGTFEQARFAGYREAGINRLSLGVQSFQPAQLSALGRIHSGDDASTAVLNAREAGFDNLNLDLMHGLPGQDIEAALADLDTALALAPSHLSWYQLTLEPNTEFYSHPPRLPEEEQLWDIQDAGHARLTDAGFQQYEISAYSRVGLQSRHNLNYWRFGDYLGIGAGAHGKLSRVDDSGCWTIQRRWKARQPDAYLRRRCDPRGFVAGQRMLTPEELPLEFTMNALRLIDGVPLSLWSARTGQRDTVIWSRLAEARKKGLVVEDGQRLQASAQGLLFLNELLATIEI
ncbi:coproporphyrinogen III oxidase, anaerobic [Franzmannia pantelleriensis]|uniref:Heme chaperone HemW n=1 Tax=Franzmannia pantelleriensis TaxID=48727 RepID=A0A1G9L7J4_9GAMM|nr:radical SAM family heme chaperone HemW [Halomonas pantelleriensis]SDL57911.1 coproporphyrinogen III oxidase, anaerobic [Halomonas pantelleriensis]